MKSTKLFAFLLASSLVLTGQSCGGPSAAEIAAAKPVAINVWGVFDSREFYQSLMTSYQAIHPNVSFNYRELRVEEYKEALVRAFAEGSGPDIFMIHNTWIGEEQSLMAPLPKSLDIPYTETKGTIKKETITTIRTERTITPAQVRKDFVDVVSSDLIKPFQANAKAVPEERVWALPLSVDTLGVYYNKDLLNTAGIIEPPATWTQFHEAVKALTSIGPNDAIIQSGAAIGTSRNTERSFDILSALMMQNGTPMTDDRGRPTFAAELDDDTIPGADATRFYADFANPTKNVYTWNSQQPPSFDAFVSGKTAFFFGYSYHLPFIKARAPKLNIGIMPFPQIEGGKLVNYANYWAFAVAKASKNQHWAWDFTQFMTRKEQAGTYLKLAQKPPALRVLIQNSLENETLTVFSSQLLTAKSWYKGNNIEVAEQAMFDLIDGVLAGQIAEDLIRTAQNKVAQTL